MSFKSYPMHFEPILKENIWGGHKLKSVLGKPAAVDNVGESWELSTVPGSVSIIANGAYESESLQHLIDRFPVEILGESVFKQFGNQFPLLFKFIDAKDDLSIQVHPSDELAKQRHNSFGKTEMWYILEADPGANLIIGFKGDASADQYLHHLENQSLPEILNQFPVLPGDVYFLETGTIHSIGAGILLAEIQQTSDITYRIYDFDRVGSDGKKRELHIDQAIDA
ncbi:MAG: class I mannose-6-phosphate isomerase, partial [Flavobacterium sp.]|nr:class I mannose-6-phosphate isomerase [Flavobacterium sp.]